MVAVIAGNGLGLFNASLNILGVRGISGQGTTPGAAGARSYVNAATGNLVLQFSDKKLSGTGLDLFQQRSYNSLGLANDGDNDNWRWDGEVRLALFGSAGAVGSYVLRTSADGHDARFNWDATSNAYVSSEGAGAHDRLVLSAGVWTYTEGSSRLTETYLDSDKRLQERRDASGNKISFAYDAAGRLISVEDFSSRQKFVLVYGTVPGTALTRLLQVDSYTLNAASASVVDSNGVLLQNNVNSASVLGSAITQLRYGYDALGRLTSVTTDLTPGTDNSITDGKIYTTNYSYDGNSLRIASVTQSDGSSMAFSYETSGAYRVKTVTDSAGTQTFTYNTGYTRVTDIYNRSQDYYYDSNGQLSKLVAANGVATQFSYNAAGDVSTITDGRNNVLSYDYDSNGNRILERDALGNTVKRVFDAFNQLIIETHYRVPDPDAGGVLAASGAESTRYIYDSQQRLIFLVSAEGRVSENVYNTQGQLIESRRYTGARYNLDGWTETTALSALHLWVWKSWQDKTQQQLSVYGYDYRGNLQSKIDYAIVDASGAGSASNADTVSHYVYSEYGQLLQTVALRGSSATSLCSTIYDGLGRVIGQLDASGSTNTVYDGSNRQIRTTNAAGMTSSQVFDSVGRLLSVTQSGSDIDTRSLTYFYDSAGQLRMSKDTLGQRNFTFYDSNGRVSFRVDGTGAVTAYSYNNTDQLLTETHYANVISASVRASWESAGVVSKTTLTVGSSGTDILIDTVNDRSIQFAYDNAGRLSSQTDGAGITTTTSYDGVSRIGSTTQVSRTTRYFYDQDGLLSATLDAQGYLTERLYNPAGQLRKTIRYSKLTNSADRALGSLATLKTNLASSVDDLTSWFYYDAQGRVIGTVDERQFFSETTFDQSNNKQIATRYANVITATDSDTFNSIKARAAGVKQVSETTFDSMGRVLSRKNAEGTISNYQYDSAGRLQREVFAQGQSENSIGNISAERATRWRYNAAGEITGEIAGEGDYRISTAALSIDNAIAQFGVRHNYDGLGRHISSTDANNNKTLFFYDENNHLRYTVNALGEVTETVYNAFGQAGSQVAYAGALTSATLAGLSGGMVTSTLTTAVAALANNTLDRRISNVYDKRGLLSAQTDAEGFVTGNTYTAYGELYEQTRTIKAGNTVTTRYDYSNRGERIAITADQGGLYQFTRTDYDAFGRITAQFDAYGQRTGTAYENYGRVVAVTDPVHPTRRSEIDAFGRTIKSTDSFGQITTYAYDDNNRSMTMTTPEGITVSTIKTRHGDTLKVVDGRGSTTEYRYNRNGQLTTTIDALGNISQQLYDNSGRLSDTIDAGTTSTHYSYDALNRVLERAVDPAGLNLRTRTEFNHFGQTWRSTEGYGSSTPLITEYNYDRKGQVLTATQDPDGLKLRTTFAYDGVGNQLSVARGDAINPNQQVTLYSYDKLNRRLTEVTAPSSVFGASATELRDITTQFKYDGNGRLTRKIDGNGNSSWYVYNDAGELRFTVDALGYVSESQYDGNGRLINAWRYANYIITNGFGDRVTSISVTGDSTRDHYVRYVYDRDGRQRFMLQAADASNFRVTENRYDSNGNVIETRMYDRLLNAGLCNYSVTDARLGSNELTTALSRNGYSDSTLAGTRRSRFAYDSNNRLRFTVDSFGYVSETVYDPVGHVLRNVRYASAPVLTVYSETAINTALDRNNSDNRTTHSIFDAAGRMRFMVAADSSVTESTYDSVGRVLTQTRYAVSIPKKPAYLLTDFATLTSTANAQNRRQQFIYDAAGRQRYSLSAGQQLHENVYDALGQLRETRQFDLVVAQGSWTVEQLNTLRGTRAVGDGVTRGEKLDYDAKGQLIRRTDAKNFVESYQYDGLGHRTRLINKLNQQWDYRYDKLGQLIEQASPFAQFQLSNETTVAYRQILTNFVYDAFGNVSERSEGTARSSDGTLNSIDTRTTRFQYDVLGQQTRTTQPGYYDPATGRVERDYVAGRFQVTIDVSYDAFGNAIRSKTRVANTLVNGLEPDSNFVTQHKIYDAMGRIAYEVNALAYVTLNSYNAFGEVNASTRYSLAISEVNGDGFWSKAEVETKISGDTLARTVNTSYDTMGRKLRVTLPAATITINGITTPTNYFSSTDPSANAPDSITPQAGNAESLFDYNVFGDLVREQVKVTATGYASTWHYYDVLGRETLKVDTLGYGSKTEYDQLGNISAVVDYAYAAAPPVDLNSAAPVYNETVTLNRRTEFQYDACNQQTLIKKTAVNYVQWDTATKQWLARNDTLTLANVQYDALGRQIAQTDALGNTSGATFDALGRLVYSVEPWRMAAMTSSTDADPFRHQSRVRPCTSYTRDAFGNIVTTTVSAEVDSGGSGGVIGPTKTTETVSPTDVIGPVGGSSNSLITLSKRDFAGNEVEITDVMGNVRKQQFDAAGRVIRQSQDTVTVLSDWLTNAQTLERRYEYDASGRQIAAFDGFYVPASGKSLRYKSGQQSIYNAFGECIEERRVWGAATSVLSSLSYATLNSYRYDQAGRLAGKTGGDGETVYFYDLAGHLTRQEQRGNNYAGDGTGTRITEFAYDMLGRVLVQRLPSFQGIASALGSVESTLQPKLLFGYDRWSNLTTSIDQAGNASYFSYDKNNRVMQRTAPSESVWTETGSSASISMQHETHYDALGRVAEELDLAPYNTLLRKRITEYNSVGQTTATVDATGVRREFAYDKYGRQIATRDGLGRVLVDVRNNDGTVQVHGILRHTDGRTYYSYSDTEDVRLNGLNFYLYDAAGRKVGDLDSAAGSNYYKLDERGNVTATRNTMRAVSNSVFDVHGRKTSETNAAGNVQTWAYNNYSYTFGQLTAQNDGVFAYNDFGQLSNENYYATRHETRDYRYLNNGLLAAITDRYLIGVAGGYSEAEVDYHSETLTSAYSYNIKGLMAKEVTTSQKEDDVALYGWVWDPDFHRNFWEVTGVQVQASSSSATTLTSYDKLDRIATVQAPAALNTGRSYVTDLTYHYDELGNRRNIRSSYMRLNASVADTKDYWYRYDAEGRVILAKGKLDPNLHKITVFGAPQGSMYSYDNLGRRTLSDAQSSDVTAASWGYYTQKIYRYDELDRLTNISGRTVRRTGSDSYSAIVASDPEYNESAATYDDRGFQISAKRYDGNLIKETTNTDYGADGRVILQTTRDKNNVITSQVRYNLGNNYDAVGNLLAYQYVAGTGSGADSKNYTVTYTYNKFFDAGSYHDSSVSVSANLAGYKNTATTNTYDYRGNLVNARIAEGTVITNRKLSYDRTGHIINKTETTGTSVKQQDYYFAGGNAVADIGTLAEADFDYNDTPLSAQYPGATPNSYVIRDGDTLGMIAATLYGDARLWYVIADANSLSSGQTGVLSDTGRTLKIPNIVGNVSNNASTTTPYNPGTIIGNTTPSPAAPPPPSEKCHYVTIAIVAAAAIAASVVTAGAASAAMAALWSTLALTGSAFATVGSAVVVGAAAAAAASAAGQAAGIGLYQEAGWGSQRKWSDFSGMQVLSSALAGGVTGGIASGIAQLAGSTGRLASAAQWFNGNGAANTAVRSTALSEASYFVGRGAEYVTGQNSSLSWGAIAAAAFTPTVSNAAGATFGNSVFGRMTQSFAGGASSAFVRGAVDGDVLAIHYGDIAANAFGDTFGNTLANAVVDKVKEWISTPKPATPRLELSKTLLNGRSMSSYRRELQQDSADSGNTDLTDTVTTVLSDLYDNTVGTISNALELIKQTTDEFARPNSNSISTMVPAQHDQSHFIPRSPQQSLSGNVDIYDENNTIMEDGDVIFIEDTAPTPQNGPKSLLDSLYDEYAKRKKFQWELDALMENIDNQTKDLHQIVKNKDRDERNARKTASEMKEPFAPDSAPEKINLSHLDNTFKTMWEESFNFGDNTVSERGGVFVEQKNAMNPWMAIVNSHSAYSETLKNEGAFYGEFDTIADNTIALGVVHTHPYKDGSNAALSTADLALVAGKYPYYSFIIAISGKHEYLAMRTLSSVRDADYDRAEREGNKAVNQLANMCSSLGGANNICFRNASEAVARSYAEKFNIAYYEGTKGVFTRVWPPIH